MKAILICPADRSAVARLADEAPLALAPALGRPVAEHWLEWLAARRVKHVVLLASDRPHRLRDALGDGSRWGVQLDVLPQPRELTPAEVLDRAEWRGVPAENVVVLDQLPGLPGRPLFESYAGWFDALQALMPRALSPSRIGTREIHPGVWIGLHAQIAASARLHAPCWIGEHALVGPDAVVGPVAVLEDRAVIDRGARIIESVIGPDTFVGQLTNVQHSLAHGGTLLDWRTGSCLQVPDAFLLCSLRERRVPPRGPSLLSRCAALLAMAVSAPFAVILMALSLLRGESPLQLRLGVRPPLGSRRTATDTFGYYELTSGRSWLRRWPQFWSVVRGDLAWFGNRPLRPTQVLGLTNDFERLWLATQPGLISLADAHGCPEGVDVENCAHASYYAVNASRRLNAFILTRCLLRAVNAWPVRWSRRRDTRVALPQLLPKQQG